ncbi:hypothetical protein CHARACLAT_002527 [Characodon lateralis]|uniref:Uncharacterized protein n=1 Tax=Characodon lateralis TaxID=208331 RepID=A0ABU7E6R2_9TELE|nr:hypothetical protein [Characodon lateralis]
MFSSTLPHLDTGYHSALCFITNSSFRTFLGVKKKHWLTFIDEAMLGKRALYQCRACLQQQMGITHVHHASFFSQDTPRFWEILFFLCSTLFIEQIARHFISQGEFKSLLRTFVLLKNVTVMHKSFK